MNAASIEPLKRFVSAKLTRLEIERLRTQYKDLQITRVWRDAAKRALIYQSTNTIQVRPANLGYGAVGKDIGWAVLDTGICADHPHFEQYKNIVAQWDCTEPGKPSELSPQKSAQLDKNGHGTHVAGIIAGRYELPTGDGGPFWGRGFTRQDVAQKVLSVSYLYFSAAMALERSDPVGDDAD